MAAALSLACDRDIEVEIIADPVVDPNVHEVTVRGTSWRIQDNNRECQVLRESEKTKRDGAYSAIRLLKSLSENMHVGT